MTPEAQQIAIAEACGTLKKNPHYDEDARLFSEVNKEPHPNLELTRPSEWIGSPPDYLNDLNTRGEMLSVLVDKELGGKFAHRFIDKWDALSVPQPRFCVEFLRTIGKWVEE